MELYDVQNRAKAVVEQLAQQIYKDIDNGEFEKVINVFGGQSLLQPQENKDLERLGEILSVGILVREGFQTSKKESA